MDINDIKNNSIPNNGSFVTGGTSLGHINGAKTVYNKVNEIGAHYGRQFMAMPHGDRNNDPVYDNVIRIRNTVAVASVFMGDFDRSSSNSTFKNLERQYDGAEFFTGYSVSNKVADAEKDLIRNAINNIGVNKNYSAIADLNKVASSNSWTVNGKSLGTGINTGSIPHFSENGFAKELSKTGMFVATGGFSARQAAGVPNPNTPNAFVFNKKLGSEVGNMLDARYGGSITNLANEALKEIQGQELRDMFINNGSNKKDGEGNEINKDLFKNKRDNTVSRSDMKGGVLGSKQAHLNKEKFLNEAKASAKQFLKNKYGIQIQNGNRGELDRIIKKIQKGDTHIPASEKEYVIASVKAYGKNFGGDKIVPIRTKTSNTQIRGRRIIAGQLLGNDIMTGVDTIMAMYQVAVLSKRASVAIARKTIHFAANLGYDTASLAAWAFNPVARDKIIDKKEEFNKKISKANEMRRIRREDPQRYREIMREQRTTKKLTKRAKRNDKIETEYKNLLRKQRYAKKRIKKNGKLVRFTRRDAVRLRALTIRYKWLKNRGVVGFISAKFPHVKFIFNKITGAFTVVFNRIKFIGKGMWMLITSPEQLLKLLIKKIFAPIILKIKAIIAGIVCSILSVGAMVIGKIITVILILMVLLFFISEIAEKLDPMAYLKNFNYVQYCVDKTSEDLAPQLYKAWQRDAKAYFSGTELSSLLGTDGWSKSADERIWELCRQPEYDCFYDLEDAEVGHLWAMTPEEQGKHEGWVQNSQIVDKIDLPGINANLIPITSMMHFRYYDDLDYLHYPNAMAYMFYMYINSHHEPMDEDEHYTFKPLPEDCSIIYSLDGGTVPKYNMNTHKTNRYDSSVKELCSNIYVHGYKLSDMEKRAKEKGKLTTKAMDWLNKSVAKKVLEWVGLNIGTGCVTDVEQLHNDGIFVGAIPYNLSGMGPTCDDYLTVCYDGKDVYGHEHHIGGRGPSNDPTTEFDMANCPGYEHHHNNDAADGGCTCGGTLEEHTHLAWTDKDHPGCYKTAYICKGHCGGHAIPEVNMYMDYDYSSLEQLDGFITPTLVTEAEMNTKWPTNIVELFEDVLVNNARSVKEWQAIWNLKMLGWFIPIKVFHPGAYVEVYYKTMIWQSADIISKISHSITGWIMGEPMPSSRDEAKSQLEDVGTSENANDYYAFDGWFYPGDDYREKYTADLVSLYGEWKDNYKMGILNWRDFDVEFPAGFGLGMSEREMRDTLRDAFPSLTDEEIENLMKDIDDPDFAGTNAQKVIAVALKLVGKYTYSLGASGPMSDTATASDCSHFVSGVLQRSGVMSGYRVARDYWNMGSDIGSMSDLHPGDVVAHSQGGSGYTGHVMIYLGPDPDHSGYVKMIDCSNPGGSRIVSRSFSGYVISKGCHHFSP